MSEWGRGVVVKRVTITGISITITLSQEKQNGI